MHRIGHVGINSGAKQYPQGICVTILQRRVKRHIALLVGRHQVSARISQHREYISVTILGSNISRCGAPVVGLVEVATEGVKQFNNR